MKIGLGLYGRTCDEREDLTLTRKNYQFARQAGCTHIVAHLPTGAESPRGTPLWTTDMLSALKNEINDEGLELAALENFEPAHWHDVLLGGPRKKQQIEDVKTMIRRVGEVGIPIIGYNFSLAGVWGRCTGNWARGGAETMAFIASQTPPEDPMPNGQVWNMTYAPDAPPGAVPAPTHEELWQRLADFLREVTPVAEEAGVRLAAHPDDPPLPTLRGYPRLVYQPHMYQRLLDIIPSRSNTLEFCLGTVQEMSQGDLYEALDRYSRQDAIAYVHCRNVRGKVPEYYEVFIDEGDIDMLRALRILEKNGFDGVLIPDHTPTMTCEAGWHAGMAFAIGYLRAALACIERQDPGPRLDESRQS